MFYIEDKNFLKENQKEWIERTLFTYGSDFPFYLHSSATPGDSCSSLHHVVIRREEERENNILRNSKYSIYFEDILKTFCQKNNITLNEILRINVNFTYNNGYEKCPIHLDHDFPHNQLILYLNDCDKDSKTVVLDDDNKTILKESIPEKYKGICFESKPHFHYYPKSGNRVILVCTFK